MKFGSIGPALTGIAVLAATSVVGCGTSDKLPVLPRLDVASVISGPTSDGAADDIAHEELVNQQINGSHQVAAQREKQAKPSLRERLMPGRKTDETLTDFTADPFLDDLDQMLANKSAANTEQPAADAFGDSFDAAKQDAAAMFGPESDGGDPLQQNPVASNKQSNPFGDIDLVASQAVQPVGDELETAVFGDGPTPDTEFDQFLQQSARPFDKTASSATKPKAGFDPLNTPGDVSLETDESEFEPFRRDFPETSRQDNQGTGTELASQFESGTPPVAVAEVTAEPEEQPTEPEIVDFAADKPAYGAELAAERTVPSQENVSVQANAPAAIPHTETPREGNLPGFTEASPPAPTGRIEIEPDPSSYEPLPSTNPDPFGDTFDPAVDKTPQFRTANRQVTVDITGVNTAPPATIISESIPEVAIPSGDAVSQPTTARALIPPGEWTAWFLIGGAITVLLLLFAPGRGRS